MSIIVKSGVPGKLPTATQLEYGQLAINYADEILYFKNSLNQIVPVDIGTDGTGTVTNVSGTGTVSGITLTGSVSTSGSLTLGGTLSIAPADFGSHTQKTFLAAPTATNGTPTFRTISASDIPVLNQNTTGNAGTVTNGVYTTGSYADPAWITSINYSKLTGTIPTWNQNTTGSAATLTTGRTISLSGDVTYTSPSFNGSANITAAATLASVGTAGTYTKVTTDAKGRVTSGTTLVASDIPALDASKITTGTLDAARLPSYVDDVIEAANLASLPVAGETGKIYVALDTNKTYRWSGSTYVFITSGAVDSVAGKTGIVTLVKGDVGLDNVDNTSDATKSVARAATLTTARTINGVSFNGSANISIRDIRTSYAGAMDSLTTNGQYYGFQQTGSAYNSISVFDVRVYSPDWIIQTQQAPAATPREFVRARHSGTTWSSWFERLHSGNFNTWSPTLIGTGASGTWGISITGNSANVTGTVAVANGGTGATTAANARTNLGATTVGSNLLTVANPGAIGFIRVNADNTVTLLDAETFREAIDASHGYAKSFLLMGA